MKDITKSQFEKEVRKLFKQYDENDLLLICNIMKGQGMEQDNSIWLEVALCDNEYNTLLALDNTSLELENTQDNLNQLKKLQSKWLNKLRKWIKNNNWFIDIEYKEQSI